MLRLPALSADDDGLTRVRWLTEETRLAADTDNRTAFGAVPVSTRIFADQLKKSVQIRANPRQFSTRSASFRRRLRFVIHSDRMRWNQSRIRTIDGRVLL